ncbi:MAG: YlmH/Sll1252 family protein [Lachnospiraceae bacterium]|jgi:RNA-binding protein YlmH
MDNENVIRARLREACEKSSRYQTYIYTDFLDPGGVSIYKTMIRELTASKSTLFGGFPQAEHQMVIFGSEEELGYPPDPPVVLLKISPANTRFSEELTHRDFLGSLMGLGIRREVMGDLLVRDSVCCVYCLDSMSEYIRTNLTQVKHTFVRAEEIPGLPEGMQPRIENFSLVSASMRIDAICAALTRESRSTVLSRFRSGEIFLNGVQAADGSRKCSPGDSLVIRHVGRFAIGEISGVTRSGRIRIECGRYV